MPNQRVANSLLILQTSGAHLFGWTMQQLITRRLLTHAVLCMAALPVLAIDEVCDMQSPCLACAAPLFTPAIKSIPAIARDQSETTMEADDIKVVEENRYRAQGNVQFQRADQYLWTEALDYDAETGEVSIQTPLRFQDQSLLATATAAFWKEAGKSKLDKANFQLRSGRGNGYADQVTWTAQDTTHLRAATFTSCNPHDPAWSIYTQSLKLDQQKNQATAKNVTLRLGDVPVFYLPWVRFPLNDERMSGLLAPTLGTSNNAGLDLVLPVYLNLAPNYDATLSPRIIAERGPMLGSEFRYLGKNYDGDIHFSYLANDQKIEHENNKTRHSFDFEHRQRFGSHWSMYADIHDVSDDRYFEDFGDSLSSVATSLLPSSAYLSGRGKGWAFSVGGDRVKVTDPRFTAGSEPYRRLPRMTASWASGNTRGPLIGIDSELVHFEKKGFIGGERVDLLPWVAWPFSGSSWFVNPRLAYRSTRYNLGNDEQYSTARNLPIASLDMGLWFERNLARNGWTQTLEPQLFALKVPYRNQDQLPVFDTQELTFGFAQLFRENRFSGADRQTDANQVALALTSRWLDQQGNDRAHASIGQIHYFNAPQVTLPGMLMNTESGSAYIAELGIALSEKWSLNIAQQWDPNIRRTELGTISAQYRFAETGVVNLTYRYRQGLLEQADLSAAFPINQRWKFVTRFNQSLRDNSLLEAFAGAEYESCCYAIRLLGRRYVRNLEGDINNGIFVELELKGFASLGRNTEDFLQRAILGYR